MAKTKIKGRSKEPDLNEMIRDYWESLETDKRGQETRDTQPHQGS